MRYGLSLGEGVGFRVACPAKNTSKSLNNWSTLRTGRTSWSCRVNLHKHYKLLYKVYIYIWPTFIAISDSFVLDPSGPNVSNITCNSDLSYKWTDKENKRTILTQKWHFYQYFLQHVPLIHYKHDLIELCSQDNVNDHQLSIQKYLFPILQVSLVLLS